MWAQIIDQIICSLYPLFVHKSACLMYIIEDVHFLVGNLILCCRIESRFSEHN